MLKVSTTWQDASTQQFRFPAYLRVRLQVVPPGLREGTTVTATNTFPQSDINLVKDTYIGQPIKWATLEPNRWLLDGSFKVLPQEKVLEAWWSDDASAESFMHFTFNKDYTIPGISFTWDTTNNSFPSSVVVKGFNAQGIQKYDITVTEINSAVGFYKSLAMDDVKSVDIYVKDWVLPHWRARAEEITFGFTDVFESENNGRIAGATQVSKVDLLSSKLPTHEFDLKLRNLDEYFDPQLTEGVAKYIARQQVVKVRWSFTTSLGVVENAPEQFYIAEKFSIPSDGGNVSMHMTNRIALLDNEFKKGLYTGSERSLSSIATYVLTNNQIITENSEQIPWIIPKSFDTIMTSAPIPAKASNAILQLIALAGCAILTTRNDNGFIEFAPLQEVVSEYCAITKDQGLGDPAVTVEDRLKTVVIGLYNYKPSEEVKEVGSSKFTISSSESLTVKYSTEYAVNVTAEVIGATLRSVQYFASYAKVDVELPADSQPTEIEIKLTGNELVPTVTYITTYNDDTIKDGKVITIENPLITSLDNAKAVAEFVKNYYMCRTQYKLKYTGYPQAEAGDLIHLETKYGIQNAHILENTVDFNGGWSGNVTLV